jgi:hypothetical protein
MASFDHPLKPISTKTLEEKIAQLISELTGKPYEASIDHIEYSPLNKAKFQISLFGKSKYEAEEKKK